MQLTKRFKWLSILGILASHSYAGFSQTDFFYCRYSHEEYFYTYHRTVQIPVLDKWSSKRWMDFSFGDGNFQGLTYAYWPNGKEIIAGISRSSSIQYVTSDQHVGRVFAGAPETPVFESASCLQNIASDDVGNMYMAEPCNNTLVSVNFNIDNPYKRTWVSKTIDYTPAGIAAIGDGNTHVLLSLANDGIIRVYTPTLTQTASIQLADNSSTILKVKSDGKLDGLGRAVLWVYGWNQQGYYIEEIHADLINNTAITRSSILKIAPTANVPAGFSPLSVWYDFIPFSVGQDQVRIVAVNYGQLHVFSSDGNWIDSPIGTPLSSVACNPNCDQDPNSLLLGYLQIATRNNSKNWQANTQVIVSDDFYHQNHGIHRFDWSPDGYPDYYTLDIQTKDLATSSEQQTKPYIQIRNLSAVKQLSNAKLRFWVSREENPKSSISADLYYSATDSTKIQIGCHPNNPNLCWVDVLFPYYWSLDPMDSTGENDLQLGIHCSDWKPWDKTNDWSSKNVTSSFASNSHVTVYVDRAGTGDWKLAWGTECSPDQVPLPFGYVAGSPGSPPTDNGLNLIQGFEVQNSWTSSFAPWTLDKNLFLDGQASAAILNPNYTTLTSQPYSIHGAFTKISFQVMQPKPPVNPYWLGQVQVSISIPSKNIYNAWIGQMPLVNLPDGVWMEFNQPLPANISTAFAAGANDVQIAISLNVPSASGVFHLDQLRFLP